jgi:acyl dehydratase
VRTDTLRYEQIQVGDELPSLEVAITPSAIVAGAIASRDYQDVHHDRDLAVKRGSKDIFMNILTTNGYVGRFVTDWAGPEALLRKVDIRLGAPNYPDDVMRMTGSVTAKQDGVVTVAVIGANELGDHVKGTVTLVLPDGTTA